MKLNADIIFDNLTKHTPVEMIGYKSEELTLSRPEFFLEGAEHSGFQANHLYLVTGESISRRIAVEKGAVIVATGEIPQMSYYHDRCCFIKVKGDMDIFRIFNLLQDIFNQYDLWSETLGRILEFAPDINELVAASTDIFEEPILVLDGNFKYLARGGYEGLENQAISFDAENIGDLSLWALEEFMNSQELMVDERQPLPLNISGTSTLSQNLYDGNDYIGSVTVEYVNKPRPSGHRALIKYLAGFIVSAMKRNSALFTSDRSVLRKVFQNIIDGMPVDIAHRKYIDNIKEQKHFVCTIFQLNSRFAQIPIEYVCNKIDNIFPKSITFESRSHIISFIETESLMAPAASSDASKNSRGVDYRRELETRIEALVGAMDIKAGISDAFADPYSAKLYYSQAQAALENGILLNPEDQYYNFYRYALTELIINAQNDLPIDMYYSDGFRRLFAHDKESPISYIDTLRVYLNNNMSVTRTAGQLYIHRSTLLERLARIRRELEEDLENPDVRLQLQILLKSMEIEDSIQKINDR